MDKVKGEWLKIEIDPKYRKMDLSAKKKVTLNLPIATYALMDALSKATGHTIEKLIRRQLDELIGKFSIRHEDVEKLREYFDKNPPRPKT